MHKPSSVAVLLAVCVAVLLSTHAAPANNCKAATLLLIGPDAITTSPKKGHPPKYPTFLKGDLNERHASLGQRAQIPWFEQRIGQSICIPGGVNDFPGVFAFTKSPPAWTLADFVGDTTLTPTTLPPHGAIPAKMHLKRVPYLTSLRADGLARLTGRDACALVMVKVKLKYLPTRYAKLSKDVLGSIAFRVDNVTAPPAGKLLNQLPDLCITLLDAKQVCKREIIPMTDAKLSTGALLPVDIKPPKDLKSLKPAMPKNPNKCDIRSGGNRISRKPGLVSHQMFSSSAQTTVAIGACFILVVGLLIGFFVLRSRASSKDQTTTALLADAAPKAYGAVKQ